MGLFENAVNQAKDAVSVNLHYTFIRIFRRIHVGANKTPMDKAFVVIISQFIGEFQTINFLHILLQFFFIGDKLNGDGVRRPVLRYYK